MPDLPESLNQYRLLDKLGEGGMGQVFLAEDSRLKRRVAIKVLPPQLATDPERLARLEREAQVLAQLEHANVAGIYGLEQAGDVRFLVMQLAEGETLADRLAAGPLPIDEALAVARQIAAGMEAAHDRGIVHRDLKPGNVMVSDGGDVKVLDFGLAKALGVEAGEASSPDLTASPTVMAATMAGVIMGTAGYMSPEQARGKPVDKRADIWAFGCVLYEMLTGDRCYDGETVTDVMAAVVTRAPDWEALPREAPASVRGLLRRCLDKDPRTRLRDIGEARVAIDRADEPATYSGATAPPEQAAAFPSRWAVVLGILAALVAGALAGRTLPASDGAAADARQPHMLPLDLPRGLPSPEGSLYVARAADGMVLIDLRDGAERVIADTEGLQRFMAWSPDGDEIAYTTSTQLRAVTLDGGRNRLIGDLPQVGMTRNVIGIDWGSGGRIAVALGQGLFEVDERGGEFVPLPGPENGLDWHYPQYLPDGRRLLLMMHGYGGDRGVYVMDRERVKAVLAPEAGLTVNSAMWLDGVLFVEIEGDNEGVLAAPMSLQTLQIDGELEMYLPGMRIMGQLDGTDLILARDNFDGGNRLGVVQRTSGAITEAGRVGGRMRPIEFSPDGNRILYGEAGDAWVHNLGSGVDQALLFSPAVENDPNYSPDGSEVLFVQDGELFVLPADGSAPPRRVERPELEIESDVWFGLDMDWGTGGRVVAGLQGDDDGDFDLFQFAMDDPAEHSWLKTAPTSEGHPAISPDGRHLAYTSDESGRNEIYVTTLPDGAGTWRISQDGGEMPRWRGDGSELFYVWENRIYVVAIDSGAGFEFGTPAIAYEADTSVALRDFGGRTYDVSPDGARFVVRVGAAPDAAEDQTLLVTNWRSLIAAGGVEH